MPARSYLRGTGKHQRLFKKLYDNLVYLTAKWQNKQGYTPSEFYHGGASALRPRIAATVMRCFIKGYKKMKPITGHAVVNVTNFAKQAKCDANVYPGGLAYQDNTERITNMFKNLKAALPTRMTLEDMMDAVLVHFNQIYTQSKRALDAYQGDGHGSRGFSSPQKMQKHKKQERKEAYELQTKRRPYSRNARVERRAQRMVV